MRDMRRWMTGCPVKTIFFGGGTPSLMSVSFLDKILNEISRRSSILPDCEITIEANPDAIDREKMEAFQRLGVNRLSLGVQALTDEALHFLGRRHSVQTALKRLDEAQIVFGRVNMDLIYARPGQTPAQWQKELKQALSLGLTHYSLYQLTIEPRTVFGKKGVLPADEETAARLYRLTDEIMNEANRPAYEASNYALPGQECRHNLTYWRGEDYIGIGPAAHGRIGLTATQNPRKVSDWLKEGSIVETLTAEQKKLERLLMGLRLRREWFPISGLSPDKVKQLVAEGYLEQSEQGIRPTLDGTLILDALIAQLA